VALKIIIGAEHAGANYMNRLAEELRNRGDTVLTISENENRTGYPAVADDTARLVVDGSVELGILICGTGIGMCMAAGKVPGVRIALCTDSYMAIMAKKHNNANMLAFGARVIGFEEMVCILDAYRSETYEGGHHDGRLAALKALENKYLKS
jgi:ribose 5-phosphate isomerase B